MTRTGDESQTTIRQHSLPGLFFLLSSDGRLGDEEGVAGQTTRQ